MPAVTCTDDKSPINQQSNIFPSFQCHWPVSPGWVFICCCFKQPTEKKPLLKPHLTCRSCRPCVGRRSYALGLRAGFSLSPQLLAGLRGEQIPPSALPGALPAPHLIKACGLLPREQPEHGVPGGEPRCWASTPAMRMPKPGGAPRAVPAAADPGSIACLARAVSWLQGKY